MILISLFLRLKCSPFFINFSLCKNTWLNVYLLLWFNIDFYSVISFVLLFFFLHDCIILRFFCSIHSIMEFWHNLRIKLLRFSNLFGTKHPIWHLTESFFAFYCFPVTWIKTAFCWIIYLILVSHFLPEINRWIIRLIRFFSRHSLSHFFLLGLFIANQLFLTLTTLRHLNCSSFELIV